MSLAQKAARGFFWTSLANLGSRAITIASTFILTRYLAPEVQGEVNVAFVLILTAGAATTLGVPQYIATHPKAGRDIVFHGSVLLLLTGALTSVGAVLARGPVGEWLHTPGMAVFVPGLAVAAFLERIASLPRNVLVRDLQFRVIGSRVALGELTYAAVSIFLARRGLGGHALVWGSIARASIAVIYLFIKTDMREYLLPSRLKLAIFRDYWNYGAWLSLSFLFHVGSVNWDNLFISYRFGEGATGLYNQAYRIAELPALSVGEQINDVLVPSLARVDNGDARRRAILRAVGLMAVVVFPMAVGIGVVAPTMVAALYPTNYQGVAPFLLALVIISMGRSIGSLATGYLQVVGRTKMFALIDFIFVVVMIAAMAVLAPLGPVAAALGVGFAFTVNTVQMVQALRPEGIYVRDVGRAAFRPLLACVPMVPAVLALRFSAGGRLPNAALLAAEILVGALVYTGAVFVVASSIARDFIGLVRDMVQKKRARANEAEADGSKKDTEQNN
ncbi:MAG: oligosaccharide flippase family protein [Polyangiaceae bacterium]|nr:oligosaccharide flippase family protein [Polyangiaceae bacterium]